MSLPYALSDQPTDNDLPKLLVDNNLPLYTDRKEMIRKLRASSIETPSRYNLPYDPNYSNNGKWNAIQSRRLHFQILRLGPEATPLNDHLGYPLSYAKLDAHYNRADNWGHAAQSAHRLNQAAFVRHAKFMKSSAHGHDIGCHHEAAAKEWVAKSLGKQYHAVTESDWSVVVQIGGCDGVEDGQFAKCKLDQEELERLRLLDLDSRFRL